MHDLAPPLSRFVGRSAELAEVQDVLREHRLVTLLGVGGIGKTRLALEVAEASRKTVDEVLAIDFASLPPATSSTVHCSKRPVSARNPDATRLTRRSIT